MRVRPTTRVPRSADSAPKSIAPLPIPAHTLPPRFDRGLPCPGTVRRRMCGICGIAAAGPAAGRRTALARYDARHGASRTRSGGTLSHPPPVSRSRRLSIIDLDGGDQPITNEDGTVHIVFNGEIYNYRELRPSCCVEGHALQTQSRHRSPRCICTRSSAPALLDICAACSPSPSGMEAAPAVPGARSLWV